MTVALDERLRREIELAGRPADPSGVYEDLIRRRERRRIVRRLQRGALTGVVIAGTIGGVYALSQVFRPRDASLGVNPSPVSIVPHDNGRITYSLSTSSGMELHSVLPDGSHDEIVPTPPGLPWLHAYSPDGSKLAVSIFPAGGGQRAIWVMNADGSNPTRIATADNVSAPSWSPDGTAIAYTARTQHRTEIHMVAPDGTGDRIVHGEGTEGTFSIFSVQFSPDGRSLLFDRGTDSGFDIFLMDVDGSNVTQLTTTGSDYDPHWSPDGSQIAFTRQEIVEAGGESVATSDIFVMNADGSGVRRLTDGGSERTNLYPLWAPDGTKIAYLAGRTGGPGPLVVMNADGSDPVELVDADVLGISWQPLPASETTPTASASPRPGIGEDIGLGFPVCHVSSIKGRFASPDANATVFVATKASDVGGCPQPQDTSNVIALDVDLDGLADTSYGPIECTLECRTFSAPDVDGDGTDELLVVQEGGAVVGMRLYDLVTTDGEPVIVAVNVAQPGDPRGGFHPGKQPTLWLGGDAFELYGLTCGDLPGPDGPGIVATAAESLPHDSPTAEWHAHQVTLVLRADGLLHVVDVRDFTEPTSATDGPSFRSGETLCGSNLGP